MTTPASQELFALSQRVATPYTALPAARAAMVTGSVAKGISDYFSDVDMSIFYDNWLPDEETLTAIRRAGADIVITYHAKDWAQRQ